MSKKIEVEMAPEVQTAPETVKDEVTLKPMAVKVTAENGLNLRGGPSTGYPVVWVLPAGTVLRVLTDFDEADDWCPVMLPELLLLGWVDRRYINPVTPGEEG